MIFLSEHTKKKRGDTRNSWKRDRERGCVLSRSRGEKREGLFPLFAPLSLSAIKACLGGCVAFVSRHSRLSSLLRLAALARLKHFEEPERGERGGLERAETSPYLSLFRRDLVRGFLVSLSSFDATGGGSERRILLAIEQKKKKLGL